MLALGIIFLLIGMVFVENDQHLIAGGFFAVTVLLFAAYEERN